MNLREQLRDKFQQEWACSQCDMPISFWESLADECIRQMEWARRKRAIIELGGDPLTGYVSNQSEQQYANTRRVIPELTLAPEDWKP